MCIEVKTVSEHEYTKNNMNQNKIYLGANVIGYGVSIMPKPIECRAL